MKRLMAYAAMVGWLVGVLWLSSRGMTFTFPTTEPVSPGYWTTSGAGNDTTIGFEAKRTGLHFIAWEATCPVTMHLHRWDETEVTASHLLGRTRKATIPYALREGEYFFDGKADCDWTVSIRPF